MAAVDRTAKRKNELVDSDTIRTAIKQKDLRMHTIAAVLGISENSVRNKLNYGTWDLVEAYRLSKLLGVDIVGVFFAHPETVKPVNPGW